MKNNTGWLKRSKGTRILALLLCLLLSGIFSTAAFANVIPEDSSLTVNYVRDDKKISGADFRLYHVGNVASDGTITLIDVFDKHNITVPENGAPTSDWNALAITLAGYAAKDEMTAEQSGTTDANGKLKFEAVNQSGKQKIYVLVGDPCIMDGKTYKVFPSLIALPGWSAANGWQLDITIVPKGSSSGGGGGGTPITVKRTVVKTWNDAGNEANRPASITVTLIDGTGNDAVVYGSVILSAENNWNYTWEGLEPGRSWYIVEDTATEGYSVATEVRESVTYIINTYTPPTTPPEEPPETPPEEPPVTPPDDPDNPPDDPKDPDDPEYGLDDGNPPTGGANPDPEFGLDDPNVPTGGALPQTGVLWWPVPIMAMAGMVMLAIGMIFRRQEQ